jgi:hypothetical protein
MKQKAASLVLDMNLYPRHHMDEACIADYVAAMKAGAKFPPVIADSKSRRVVDGWKRTTATLRAFGQDADIEVNLREYRNQQEVLLDAIALNASHGERLTHYDMRRCQTLCEELKIPDEKLAEALHMSFTRFERLILERVHPARIDGDRGVAGKLASEHLSDKPLSVKQETALKSVSGTPQLMKVNEVILLIRGNLLDKGNDKVMAALEALYELLGGLFDKREAA